MLRATLFAVAAAAALLSLAPVSARAQPVYPTSGLTLYDADGERVGPVVRSSGAGADFVMRVGEHALFLHVTGPTALTDGVISGNVRVGPWFEAADCAGPVLLSVEEARDHGPFTPVLVESSPPGDALANKSLLYVPDPSQEPRVATIRSGISVGTCHNVPEGPAMVVPMLRVADFSKLYRVPLHARAEPAFDLPDLARRVEALEAENAALREP